MIPVAEKRPVQLTAHGHVRVDDYYWMRDRDNPQVISYLEAENAFSESTMAHTDELQSTLFEEIRGRIVQTDASAPVREGDYLYYTRYEDGLQYAIHCRKRESLEAPEEVLLDVNEMAEGHEFLQVSRWSVSPGQDLLAWAEDIGDRRIHTIRFVDLAAERELEDELAEVTANFVWAQDNRTLFYVKQDPETLRWHRLYRHQLGTDQAADDLVYEEEDDTFDIHVRKTRSLDYLLLASTQTLATEYRYLQAGNPDGQWQVFEPRRRDHEYHVDHAGDYFYVRSNWQAPNFCVFKTPVHETRQSSWREVIAHRQDVLVENVAPFRDFFVVEERRGGLCQLRLQAYASDEAHYLDFAEPAYLAFVGDNRVFDTATFRYVYSSLTTPKSDFDYDMNTHDRELVKQEEILGGFDAADYQTERLHARAQDGMQIPISLVYRAVGHERNGSNPLLLYSYGSYGISLDAEFSPALLSLLDRGFVFAVAHIRGGQELGRHWYEDGKLLNKRNTFTDFISCAEHLIAAGYCSRERLFAEGGSAGGLLMGAVCNMRPDLFCGVVAHVPFVDVVTTMLDDSIPLTTGEYDEWGNPNTVEYYEYMLSYSPYDNVEAKAYPHLLVIAGLHDSQVQYWEPTKWVAKLRTMKTDDNRLLLRTHMEAGHGGVSGRYKRYRETALTYAFLLDLAG